MTLFRRLSCVMAIAFSTTLFSLDKGDGGILQPQFAEPDTAISLETKDIDLFLEGRLKEEFYYLDKVSSLRDDYFDTYHFFRNKIKLNAYAEYGRRKYGRTAAQAEFRLAAFNYWDDALRYTELSEEGTYFNAGDPHKKILLGEHTHNSVVPLTYLSKSWMNIDFDVLYPNMTPTALKIGYFRYKVGRGISLGSFFDGAVSYMGWTDYTCASNATQSPPGILLEIEFNEKCALELYYSKLRSRTATPSSTRDATRARHLALDYLGQDPREIERGTKADTDIYSIKGELDVSDKHGGIWHFEPYTVAVNAPEQNIEFTADASARFGTSGMMVEYHKGQFSLNAEAAIQYGYQDMHAVDRNSFKFKIDPTTGGLVAKHSHLQLKNDPHGLVNPHAEKDLDASVNLPENRSIAHLGEGIRDAAGTQLQQTYSAVLRDIVSQDYPFGGLGRFRKGYRINYGGYMGLVDMAYRSKNGRVTLGAAGAWVSGDKYPYNGEKNKNYGGFIPLRDQNYFGKYVRSFAVLYARKMPRPVDMADHKLYAFNNAEDTSNLRYIGLGAQINPLKDPRALTIMPVWFSFWEDCPPYKWYGNASRTFRGNKGHDAVYAACQKQLGFVGAADETQLASRHLGHEFSLAVMWKPMENCEISSAFSAFLPGKLYADTEGMPNRNTRRLKPNGDVVYESLGTGVVFGSSTKISFRW